MSDDRISQVIRAEVRELSAYHVPDSHGYVKLDAMENPHSLPDEIRQQWLNHLHQAELNRYPDACAGGLKSRLREVFNMDSGVELLIGNGSDEIIQIIQMATARQRKVLAPEPTFVMYEMIARFVGTQFVGVPLDQDFQLDRQAILTAIDQHQPAVIFLAYPNNPTGNLFDRNVVIDVIRAAPGLVVIDEAYQAFANDSLMDQLESSQNLLIMGTLSKLGLAGLRLGYAVAAPQWIQQFEKIRLPYNINVLTQLSVEFVLSHMEILNSQASLIKSERQRVFSRLIELGYMCYPSACNFILFRSDQDADRIHQNLLDRNILIKNLSHAHPTLRNCLRVTIGSAEENDAFLNAMTQI